MTEPLPRQLELTEDDAARLEKQRAFIQRYLADDASRAKYERPSEGWACSGLC